MNIRQKFRSALHQLRPPKPRPLILMYHRIAKDPIDAWGLSVSPARFQEQLEVLRRTRRPIPLADFVLALMAGTLSPDAVAVTFDDGYVDNLIAGKPLLTAADVPATVFLATGYLGHSGEFWWDELSRLVLSGDGPRNFEVVIGGKTVNVDIGADRRLHNRPVPPAAALKARKAALTSIWELMRRVDDGERQRAMNAIRSLLKDTDDSIERGRVMTKKEVKALTADGLVSIGAHTITHPRLPDLTDADCSREIIESKSACEAITGAPVTGFAYPYGDFDASVRKTVSAANFSFACSTRHAPASSSSDILALPRIQICNWNADVFQRVLHRWSAAA